MKKTILLLCAAVWIMAAGCIKKSGITGPLTWTLKKNGTLIISGMGDMPYYAPYSGGFPFPPAPWDSCCTDIRKVDIKEGVTSIGDAAFYGCRNLTSVSIPNSVTTIGNWVFWNCTSLKSIAIPNSVTIFALTFENCDSLTAILVEENNPEYSSLDGVLFNKTKTELICCPVGKTGEYIIPNSVTSIGDNAFYHCRRLKKVIVKREEPIAIGSMTFYDIPDDCILEAPQGAKVLYENAEGWKDFAPNIVESTGS